MAYSSNRNPGAICNAELTLKQNEQPPALGAPLLQCREGQGAGSTASGRAPVGSAMESSALLWASVQGVVRMGVQALGLLCANSGVVLVCSPQPLLTDADNGTSSPPPPPPGTHLFGLCSLGGGLVAPEPACSHFFSDSV